jgi:hypothetical protein
MIDRLFLTPIYVKLGANQFPGKGGQTPIDKCVLGQISRVRKSTDKMFSLANLELADAEYLHIRSFSHINNTCLKIADLA